MCSRYPLLLALFLALPVAAEDHRQLAALSSEAQATLRQEMLDNLIALNEILSLVAANKIKDAGEVAENSLGRSAMGKNARLPFAHRPGPQMPPAMHEIGIDGHTAASEFAKAAATGDREKALSLLPNLTGGCVACHYSWRTR